MNCLTLILTSSTEGEYSLHPPSRKKPTQSLRLSQHPSIGKTCDGADDGVVCFFYATDYGGPSQRSRRSLKRATLENGS